MFDPETYDSEDPSLSTAKYRYSYTNGRHHFHPLDEEMHFIRRFSSLEQVLFYQAKINGNFCSEYVFPENCYPYFSLNDVLIVPIESVFSLAPNDMGESERRRTASIEQASILHPIDVRQVGNRYEIINGNHRYRFSVGRFTHIPVHLIHC